MADFSLNLPPSSRVSELRAIFEAKSAGKITLTTAGSSPAGINPRKTDHFAPSNTPTPASSPQCRNTAENIHDAVITKQIVKLATPLEMTYSEHIETTLELKRPPNPQMRHEETVITLTLSLQFTQTSEHTTMTEIL